MDEINDPRRNEIDLGTLFGSLEHGIYCYYGRIGQGKTYALTADIIEALRNGKVVYSNYPLNWNGFDERDSLASIFMSLFFLKNKFYTFHKENLHYIAVDEKFHDNFSKLTDCIVALDEGYVAFDSYELAKMSMQKRQNVLHTRHFDRSIWYTTQRVNAVHITMRAQTNVFYKITKVWDFLFIIFRRQELDLGKDDTIDENTIYSTKLYLGRKQIFQAYNTKYLRGNTKSSQSVSASVNSLKYLRRWNRFFNLLFKRNEYKEKNQNIEKRLVREEELIGHKSTLPPAPIYKRVKVEELKDEIKNYDQKNTDDSSFNRGN